MKQHCTRIGSFIKPHGIEGNLLLQFIPDLESAVAQATVLLTETDGLLLPWFTAGEGILITGPGMAVVSLDRVTSEPEARKLCGMLVYLENSALSPGETAEEEASLTGFTLMDGSGAVIGMIIREDNFSGNLVLTVKTPAGNRMVPFHRDLLLGHDLLHKTVTLEMPPGLLEL